MADPLQSVERGGRSGNDGQIPQRVVLQWADESQPYGDFIVDGVVYNVNVSEKIPVEGRAGQENKE